MPLSENMRGAVLMMGSMAAFTLNDTFMKTLAGTVPLMQVLLIRGVLTVVLMLFLARAMGKLQFHMPRRDWGMATLRMLGEVGAAYFFLTALFHMPLANVSAVLQALPLTVTLAGAVFLGEAVGWRRLLAILIGFGGVMLIIRPGPEGFNIYSIYVLIAVVFVTLRDLSARRLSPETPSIMVAVFAAFGVMVFAGGMSLVDGEPWVELGLMEWGAIGAASLFVIAGYTLSVAVMRIGEIAVITPFRYSSLLWALIMGFLVFGDWPDNLTLLGAGIVVATGIFTFYREQRSGRAAQAAKA